MIEDQRENLCSTCQDIDLGHLFRGIETRELIEPDPALILHRVPEWTSPSCPLCIFFLDMIPGEQRETCNIMAIYRASHVMRNGSTNDTPLNAPTMTARTTLLVRTSTGEQKLDDLGFVNYSLEPEKPVLIDHHCVDYEPLREWRKRVEEISREAMDVLPVAVIDCHKREIVPVGGPLDYVALSYVWGPAAVQGTSPKGNQLPPQLPRTVEDAMTVVKELGLQYLWVDRYCLDQSNKAQFKAQLDQMADIYRHALVTIIGAAGSDADYGLPGVSSRSRIKQPRVRIGNYTLWSSMTDPRKLVRESAWMTRAWTYQEGVFSWNWMAFTDEQVFFQRSNKEWANMERWWRTSSEMYPRGGLGPEPNCPLLQMYDNVWKNEGGFHQLLMHYTGRKLTYQSDALNGTLGLLKRCENGPYNMNHYFGIPILGPLINHRKAMGRDPSRSWTQTEAFLVNVCWKTRGTGPRRVEFPSWSWAGWQAVYERPAHSLTYLGLYIKSLIRVKLSVKMEQGMVDWEEMCRNMNWDVYEDFKTLPRELYIQAPTVRLTICRNQGPFTGTGSGHAADLASMSYCAVFSDDECDAIIEVNLVDETVESTLLTSKSISVKGILLRQLDHRLVADYNYHENQIWAFALLAREDDEGATRVGSLELRPDNYFVRWKRDVDHPDAKGDRCWVREDQKEFVACDECRKKALDMLVGSQKDELVKLL